MNFFSNHEKTATLTAAPVQAQVPKLRDADLAALYYGERLGGDFYDFIRVSPNRVVFGLLDVAGRSEQTKAILSTAQETFRTQAQRLLANDNVNEADAMTEICLQLNRTVLQVAGGVHACPAFAGCYNENLGIVCYFNAGHPAALVRDSTGIAELTATGLPLGLFSHATCESPMTALAPEAALLLVSRGVIEGKFRGEEFGLGRVKETFQRSGLESAKDLCRLVIEDVREFMHTPPTHNDVTALSLIRGNTN